MKVSVIIVTRDRKDDMRVTLDAYKKQTYENKEIIVIDNESTDGTREMMAEEYPEIKYLWLPDNFDIRAINLGIEMSDGDIIWRTDSDSNPESDDAFEKTVKIFEENPDIHVIATEDIEVRRGMEPWDWYPINVDKTNVPSDGFKSHCFPGTGAAIRRSVYDKIGGFWGFGFEEMDFCTRAIAADFNVRYFPNIRTLHYASPNDRNSPNRWVLISKQYIRYHWRYFPFWIALGRTTQIYIFQMIQGALQRLPISALIEGAFGMLEVAFSTYRNERDVVPEDKIEDITLGTTITRAQYKFVKQKLTGIFKRIAAKFK